MTHFSNCCLCDGSCELQDSHIIPRSYFRGLKGKSGQLICVSTDESIGAKLTNSDPKEKLLCRECEQFISVNYERYGTRLFKDHRKVKKTKQIVEFKQFRFKEFYLFLISILWRASISELPRYEHIDLGKPVNDLLKHCLKNNTIKIQTSLRLDHFFKISVVRIVDKTSQLTDLEIKKIMVDLNVEKAQTVEGGMLWYFMVDGFLIAYHFSPESDIHAVRTKRNYAQITNRSKLIVPIADVSDFKQVSDAFVSITKQAVKFNKK
ncbi:hypothetical protein [Vibrio coralliilyticus]|uniref:hypothetical protein n=1 Tax=Vibrio coralliilyticus TaxID=190893 RepID=UPI000BAADE38|nr:hypothetical protein [Vibrio coralliilyticus]NOI60486.1 hypothetical protein [Vibrio coralliilyticus]PAT67319.1 hypothetical protein CKA27_15875 [Vibrio coralliilyticus]